MDHKKYKAILFDFDGVIGQTMEDNFLAWKHALQSIGIEVQDREYYRLEGSRAIDVAHYFLRLNKRELTLAPELAKRKDEYYAKNNKFSLYPGASDFLKKLQANTFRLALISGAARARIEKTMPAALFKIFSAVICAEDVTRPKPDPEPYLTAARKLSLAPQECLVIENAPLGIRSACAAGMDCYGVASTLPAEELKGAIKIFSSLLEISALNWSR